MDDNLAEEQADEDEGEDDEWDVDDRLLPESLSCPTRTALDWFLRRWQPGMRVSPTDILNRAQVLVRENPGRFGPDVGIRNAIDIIDAYDIMGWIEVDRSEGTAPVVVNVQPIYARQCDGIRSMSIGNRYDRQERNRQRREREANLGGAIEAMGLSRDDDVATLTAKLQPLGLAVKFGPHCFPMTSCVAVVWKPTSGNDHGYKGMGDTESEALCFAAAYAFLASAGEPQA